MPHHFMLYKEQLTNIVWLKSIFPIIKRRKECNTNRLDNRSLYYIPCFKHSSAVTSLYYGNLTFGTRGINDSGLFQTKALISAVLSGIVISADIVTLSH